MTIENPFLSAIKDISAEFRAFMGMPDPSDSLKLYRSLREYATAPADEAWVYRCMTLLSQGAAGIPLRVYVRSGASVSNLFDSPDVAGQDLQDLLDNVNTTSMSGWDLKAFTTGGKGIWGEAYWKKVRGRLGGPTQELHWLPAPDLAPKRNRTWIDHYEYRPGAGIDAAEDLRPENVLAFRTLNLTDPTRGLSPLSAVRYELNVNQAAAQQTAYTLANWGIPPGAWVIPQNSDFTTQDKSLVRRALRALRGPRGAGRIPILPQGLTWQALALNPKDAEWLAARKVSRMTVCAAMGVPLVLAGDDEKTTVYANLRDAERVMWRMRLIPDLDSQADVINNWLVPEFDRTRRHLTVAYDYSGIEALRPMLTEEMKAWIMFLNHMVVTPNETRRFFKLGPDVPWGDEPLTLNTVLPADVTGIGIESAGTPAPPDLTLLEGGASEAGIAHLLRTKGLYRRADVQAFLGGAPLNAEALLGEPASSATRERLETGLRRRYSPGQIARGEPREGFDGLTG